ncbi:hypothetical protein CAAN1_03S03246 [[Candida] anglica]|uniref:Uncharacterized protein n=1 Tax=[Candida] anglica TaxID=148631 RepID=A0ABP0EGV3_9ASCO
MIRRNYSLADERRQFEKKQQAKVQQRQKRAHQQSRLESVDPVRLYYRMKRLDQEVNEENKNGEATKNGNSYNNRKGGPVNLLKSLKEDWAYILKNELHKTQVDSLLAKEKQKEDAEKEAASKLWGKQSVYFNPELNPLGKVPTGLGNFTIPLPSKSRVKTPYKVDPEIERLGVILPEGEPPRFYKEVQNFGEEVENTVTVTGEETNKGGRGSFIPSTMLRGKKQRPDTKPAPRMDIEEDEDDGEDSEYGIDGDLAPEEEAWKRMKS